MLREADEEQSESKGEDSLDAQVDRYLSDYESEAKNTKNEGLDIRLMTRRFLVEAEGDEEDKEGTGDEAGGEEEKDAEAGDEPADEDATDEPEKLTIEDIDVKSFVTDVMRLVDNYDNLLEVRNTILRRAESYLGKSYEKDVVDSFKEELLESYGVEVGVSKFDKESEAEFQPPNAGAAGPMGGSGGA